MNIKQDIWTPEAGWKEGTGTLDPNQVQLILGFGKREFVTSPDRMAEIRARYPHGECILASTSGNIGGISVTDDSIVVTALQFSGTTIKTVVHDIGNAQESETVGNELGTSLPHEHLVHVLVFSDGLKVNGTALVTGLTKAIPKEVAITGGLVGDGADFKETVLGLNTTPTSGKVVVIGLYGDHLHVGYGSVGGWDPFGPNRKITKAKENVLFELDGKPALSLYKEYLGDRAKDLPASGLLFPLSLTVSSDTGPVELVRTLLAVNEEEQSMTFAGDMPEGVVAKFMKANFERLIDGSGRAASHAKDKLGGPGTEFALLISCVGRKLVLKERTEEEVEAVRDVIDGNAVLTGFYSYGEICPTAATSNQCQLHNQTMTITTFREE